jgi:hypothetical protein
VTVGTQAVLQAAFRQPLVLGSAGNGQLSISGRSFIATGNVIIGELASGQGTLSLGGSQFRVLNQTTVDVGLAGTGVLSINGGGSVQMERASLSLGRSGGHGSVSVDGLGSTVNARDVTVFSPGEFSVANGATLVVSGTLTTGAGLWTLGPSAAINAATVSTTNPTPLRFEIGTAGTGVLTSLGNLSFAGALQVDFAAGVTPTAGETYDLLNWTTSSGSFSQLQLAALPQGLAWDSQRLYVDGTFSVVAVPELPTAWMWSLGLFALPVLRRTKHNSWV